MVKWLLSMIFVLLVVIAVLIGRDVAIATNPVCHAITEDSYISDCDYHNGAWYRK